VRCQHTSIRFGAALALAVGALAAPAAVDITLPNAKDSVKIAIIGDSGTGDSAQYKIAEQLIASRQKFPFEFALMMGDNLYGGNKPKDYDKKFETPYKPLLDSGMKFYASLGNHDNPNERMYKMFNMNGERFYTFKPKNNVRFFALDSTRMDDKQLAWIDTSLQQATEDWKICYFHHPLYSNADRHGASVDLRVRLEPIFIKHGVNVVFSGHDHVYERVKPQKGISYFVSGAAGQLRRGNMSPAEQTAAYFDQDQSFMAVEIAGSEMYFEAVSRTGKIVDSGTIMRQAKTAGAGSPQLEPAASRR